MNFFDLLNGKVVLFDGAMGTEIQKLDIQDHEWGGYSGCNEFLNLSSPDRIAGIHLSYLEAGADVIETNTFGANEIVLAEYGLESRTVELNRAAAKLSTRVRDEYQEKNSAPTPRFVAGSMGPGTKLPSLAQVDFDTIHASYLSQARGLIAGGVDLFLVETAQDLLQIKAAVLAARDAQREAGLELPIVVSVTVETNGNLLVGSDISTVVTSLLPMDIDVLGINCATGPKEMRPHVQELCSLYPGPVFVMPNAGFPTQREGKLVYDLKAEDYAETLTSFVSEYGVDIIGGCCGTNAEYIGELRRRLDTLTKAERPSYHPNREQNADFETRAALSSLYSRQDFSQEPPPFFIGERANTNGSKKFREQLLAEDWERMLSVAKEQQKTGAHALDICLAYTGRDEVRDMTTFIRRLRTSVDLPLVIDSTRAEVIEEALKLIGGRALINSVNLENGPEEAGRIFSLAKRYGAAIIALTIDEEGMAHSVERKMGIARRLLQLAVDEHGLSPSDLIIDPLTFTLGSGDQNLRDAGAASLEALRRIKEELPGVHTVMGISNISFGLAAQSREYLNSVFLSEAIDHGLDMAIVNVRKIMPMFQIPDKEKSLALDLIYNKGQQDPLMAYIEHFQGLTAEKDESATDRKRSLSPEESLREAVMEGNRAGLEELIDDLLQHHPPKYIIDTVLIGTMKEIGELFGQGKIQLPFVLQSAEVMKQAVDYLENFMEKKEADTGKKLILATVKGDVHDIGKNLVDIILSNNGYQVQNLGIKVDVETIIEQALKTGADAIGMSGLLVKSTVVMRNNIRELQARGLKTPVLLGGAALTKEFVEQQCAPLFDAPVYYCRDAFDALRALSEIEAQGPSPASLEPKTTRSPKESQAPEAIASSPTFSNSNAPSRVSLSIDSVPQPADLNLRMVRSIDPAEILDRIHGSRLFRGRWGYRKGASSEEEYLELEQRQIRPAFERLKEWVLEAKIIDAVYAYRFFPCFARNDALVLIDPDRQQELVSLDFARQRKPPYRSVADYFLPEGAHKRDLTLLQIVSLGSTVVEEIQRLFHEDQYRDYLHLHGLAVEMTEVLADYVQELAEEELYRGAQGRHGTRYSFGYPCCPDLDMGRVIGGLLSAEQLGIQFTESGQMIPEFSTSAFVSFHPEAEYFSL
ncbi:MAG TPA: methionine synthase [Sediminispirochaeta sp.]|nr:methionine synthase [Sediminispirochaeta sp.]